MSQTFIKSLTNEWRLDLIGIGIFVLLTALAYLLEFEPAMRDRETMRAGTVELADKCRSVARLHGILHSINEQIAALETASVKELKLRPQNDVNDRLSDLATLAGDQGLQVEAIEPGQGSTALRYSTVPIRINGRGSFTQIDSFLRMLRARLPDTSVTDVNISGPGTGGPVSFAINLQWFAAPSPVVAKTDLQ